MTFEMHSTRMFKYIGLIFKIHINKKLHKIICPVVTKDVYIKNPTER